VCEYCLSDTSCDHGAGKAPSSPCACSLAGTKKCPQCGCECESWDSGLGFDGPAMVRSFFGVGDDENPGFSGYPASKRQILSAATQELQDAEANPADLEWLSRTLPDGTYPDRGAALTALSPVLSWSGNDPALLVAPLPMHAIAVGTRLVVGRNQSAVLVGRTGRPLDLFGPGEYTVTRESAPLAAAVSRPAATGFPRSVITARPFFAATRETRIALNRTARARSGESIAVRGTVTFSIASLGDFIARAELWRRVLSAAETESAITGILGRALDQTLAAHDASELDGSSQLIEESIRSSAGQAGLRVSSVTLDSVGRVSLTDQMAAMQKKQLEAMAHLPPEVQARIQAQMATAMARSQAARGSTSGVPAAGTVPGTPAVRPSPGAVQICPSCQASNPSTVRFCGNCGKPLSTKRLCSRCGSEVAVGVKFCGNCGSPVG
jgi:membrane protease subunit (stomatin/prohibitin family)